MNKEEIRQKAIECGKAFNEMCYSNACDIDDGFDTICHCEYNEAGEDVRCSAVYGYEHGFADGVEEGEKKMSGIIIRNIIACLEDIKYGYGTLDEFIEQLKGAQT